MTQARTANTQIARALLETLISPNESDRNLEAANVVDGLFAIARAINGLSQALNHCHECARELEKVTP